jgi:hypothetical protein
MLAEKIEHEQGYLNALRGILDDVLDLFRLLEIDLGRNRHRCEILEAVDNHVRNSALSRVANLQADSADAVGRLQEQGDNIVIRNLEDGRVKDGALRENLDHLKTELERLHAELREKNGLRAANLLAGCAQLNLGDDLNGALNDLSRYTEGLEEVGLGRLEASRTRRNLDILRGDSSSFSSSHDLQRSRVKTESEACSIARTACTKEYVLRC